MLIWPTFFQRLKTSQRLLFTENKRIAFARFSTVTVESIVPGSRLTDKVAEISAPWSDETGIGPPPIEDQSVQSSWMRYAQTSESLLDNANVITQVRLLAASSTESAAFLAALPVSTFGNLLDDASLCISVGLRLGASICSELKCVCGGMVDKWGIMDWPVKEQTKAGSPQRTERVYPESSRVR